jgi:hypothetical protein
MCFSPLGRKTSELEGEVLVGSFPGIYMIGNKIKSTKVARFNLAAEFREKTVKKSASPKKSKKPVKNWVFFSSLFPTFYDLYLLFFTVF